MSPYLCPRPLDPADAQALASGEEPPFAADAAAHAARCPSCGAAVREAALLSEALEGLLAPAPPAGLAAQVVRLRPFSRAERRSLALWRGPLSLSAGVFLAGTLLLALPGLSAADQAGLGAAALAPLAGVLRSCLRWISEVGRSAPEGVEALASALRQEASLGLAALLLLLPAGLGLRRTLARAAHRR